MIIRPLLVLAMAALLALPKATQAQKFSTAGEYMGHMSEQYQQVTVDMWDYSKAVAHKSARKVDKRRQEMVSSVKDARKKIARMKDFEGDTVYRDSAVSFLNITYLVLVEDYAKIVDMEEIAEQSYDNMEAYLLAKEKVSEKRSRSQANLQAAQKVFADKHKITLLEDNSKLAKNLEKSNEVFDYYYEIYLIFFKPFKQEAYMLEAMSRDDMSGIEQNKSSLVTQSDEGLTKLKDIKPFFGDGALKVACINLLRFYKQEAEDYNALTDYLLKKETFAKMQQAFEGIKPKNRTKEDVEKYNTAVNEMNAASEKYNKVNDEVNKTRTKMLDTWNKEVDKFLERHIPKR